MTTPTLRFELGSTVAPGDRLGSIRQVASGRGTYVRGGHVYASAVGKLTLTEEISQDRSTVSFRASVQLKNGRELASSHVISIGKIVLGRVLRIMLQQAVVDIVAMEGVGSLAHHHEGAIRREDVRAGGSEEIEIQDAFRPGDVVLCRVLSLGDSRRYFLSTAETELGVVRANCSKSGYVMVPISWKEMQCPETNEKEPRKCAKPTKLTETLCLATKSQLGV